MAVLTNDIRDTDGNDATPDRTYNFGKTSVPWVDANGNSTNPLFHDATAAHLELIRQVVQSMELNAAAYRHRPGRHRSGLDRSDPVDYTDPENTACPGPTGTDNHCADQV